MDGPKDGERDNNCEERRRVGQWCSVRRLDAEAWERYAALVPKVELEVSIEGQTMKKLEPYQKYKMFDLYAIDSYPCQDHDKWRRKLLTMSD